MGFFRFLRRPGSPESLGTSSYSRDWLETGIAFRFQTALPEPSAAALLDILSSIGAGRSVRSPVKPSRHPLAAGLRADARPRPRKCCRSL